MKEIAEKWKHHEIEHIFFVFLFYSAGITEKVNVMHDVENMRTSRYNTPPPSPTGCRLQKGACMYTHTCQRKISALKFDLDVT